MKMVIQNSAVLMKAKTDAYHILVAARFYSTTKKPSFTELDKKWIKIWKKNPPRFARSNANKDNDGFYVLSMFPYPSGMLHMGHVRVYAISDIMARYRRMNGLKVVHAMGWDAFGLPAENAAIERKIDPSIWTIDNIGKMKEQMNQMLADFDWEREIVSCSPEYYKWTQKLFTMLYKAGYAYRKEASVNWDPVDKTVLANEQVDAEGRSWRSGAIVEKKMLKQWFLSITKFAPDLLEDLKLLEDWPSKVKTMQKNWIGKSNGAEITFLNENKNYTNINVFTTRPDTLFGVQYIALSLDHPVVLKSSLTDPELVTFLSGAKDM
ncbi:Nucleotidylyl transferase, partial [Nadsonia fulvescens var. elongata DSM 6958]